MAYAVGFWVFTLVCAAYNLAKYPWLLDWSRPYALGRIWGFNIKLATTREFMIAHSFLMISANVVAAIIGIEAVPINTKWFLLLLEVVNFPLVMAQWNKLASLPTLVAAAANVLPLVAANVLLWIFLHNENLDFLIASYAVKDAVTGFEFFCYLAVLKDPRVRVRGACPFMLDTYEKKPAVPSTKTGEADQPAVNPLDGMPSNPFLRQPKGNNCNSWTYQGLYILMTIAGCFLILFPMRDPDNTHWRYLGKYFGDWAWKLVIPCCVVFILPMVAVPRVATIVWTFLSLVCLFSSVFFYIYYGNASFRDLTIWDDCPEPCTIVQHFSDAWHEPNKGVMLNLSDWFLTQFLMVPFLFIEGTRWGFSFGKFLGYLLVGVFFGFDAALPIFFMDLSLKEQRTIGAPRPSANMGWIYLAMSFVGVAFFWLPYIYDWAKQDIGASLSTDAACVTALGARMTIGTFSFPVSLGFWFYAFVQPEGVPKGWKGTLGLTFMRICLMFALCWNQAAAFGGMLFLREFAPSRSFIRSSTRVRAIWGMTQPNDTFCAAAKNSLCNANPDPQQGGAHHLDDVKSLVSQPKAGKFAGEAQESMGCCLGAKVCCLRDCFDCFMCTTRCATSTDEYVKLFTELFGTALDSKADWVNAKVPIPVDGTLSTLNHRLADFFALDGNGIDHVDQFGSSLQPSDIASYWMVNRALQFWPTDNALNWSSEAECDQGLFGDTKHYTKLALPFDEQMASIKGLQYLFSHNMGHHLLRRVVVPGDPTIYVEATTHELKGPKMDRGMASLDTRTRFKIVPIGDRDGTATPSTAGYPSITTGSVAVDMETKIPSSSSTAGVAGRPTSKLVFVEIEYEGKIYRGGEPDFIDAIRVVQTATLTIIQLREHALYTHLTFGDGFIVSNIKQLPGVHPLRRLLGQCEFGVLQLNEGGLFVLLSVHGDFDRVFNFHHDGLIQIWDQARRDYRPRETMPLPGFLQSRGLGDINVGGNSWASSGDLSWCPILEDCRDWWATMDQYVANYFNVYFPTEDAIRADPYITPWYDNVASACPGLTRTLYFKELKAGEISAEIRFLCTTLLYVSSVYHEKVGSPTYLLGSTPYRISSQWRHGKTLEEKIASRYVSVRACSIAKATTVRAPRLMIDWGYMAAPGDKQADAQRVMKGYYDSMVALQARMVARNNTREISCPTLFPEEMECSLSV